MSDEDVLGRIRALVDEEHRLRSAEGEPADSTPARLSALEQQLDQCWDLLRQRRAAKEFGTDPGAAEVRPVSEVEGYLG
jgi:Protein of unknown function (DUF2630)